MVSSVYVDLIASHWRTAFAISIYIGIFCTILFIIITAIICHNLDGKSKHCLLMTCELIVIFLLIGSWMLCANSNSNNVNSAVVNSPNSIKSYNNKFLSMHTIPTTLHHIQHNQKVLPQEWRHDEYLLHHTGKEPSRNHVMQFRSYTLRKNKQLNYQKELIHKEHFDKSNKRFCTKKYIKMPTFIDYL